MGFFNTVQYSSELQDNSWCSLAEGLADVCRVPSRWVASELWKGGQKYEVTNRSEQFIKTDINVSASEGLSRIIRLITGLVLTLPGALLAIPLMALAYQSREISLKHKIYSRPLNLLEKRELADLIEERKKKVLEAQERALLDDEFNPVSGLFFSTCCLMCYVILF